MIKTNIINDYNKTITFQSNKINHLVAFIFDSEHYKNGVISVILSNREYLSNLKKIYFNLNQYTDVIAFNLEDNGDAIDGEIYISIDDVLENAKLYSKTFNNEFKRVLIHGVLHLLGYEDKENIDIKKMRRLEKKYLLNCDKEIIKFKC